MPLTHHLGYGRFRLEDFRPGEQSARFDGSLASVCHPQPSTLPADRIQVWIDAGTSNARKVSLQRTALAYALTPAQARTIERRRRKPNAAPLVTE